ncbi:MAG: serine protease [Cyanobium sp.]
MGSGFILLAAALALSAQSVGNAQPTLRLPAQQASEQANRKAVTALLRDLKGDPIGSAVVVAAAAGGHWLATNRHVVEGHAKVCVVTADQRSRPALWLEQDRRSNNKSLDLALLWLPVGNDPALVTALMAPEPVLASQLPVVVATGFPTRQQGKADGVAGYREASGLLLPLLPQPLEGGFDLAYAAAVEKGMSGGGVFDGDRLIGINGSHPHPLWPGRWKQQNGKPISEQLNQQVELVALGLSVAAIQERLKQASPPAEQATSKWEGESACKSQSTTADPTAVKAW